MSRRLLTAIFAVLSTLGLVLGVTTSASAAQNGLQSVYVTPQSWSAVHVHFACGYGYNVPVGQVWGEGRNNPLCGNYGYEREPSTIYVGPGWCVTRWIVVDGVTTNAREYFHGGGSGGWFQIWSSHVSSGADYQNRVESWYGSWCPTSGAAGRSGTKFS